MEKADGGNEKTKENRMSAHESLTEKGDRNMDDKEKDTSETGIGSNASTLGGAVAGAVAGSALGVPVVGTVIGGLSGAAIGAARKRKGTTTRKTKAASPKKRVRKDRQNLKRRRRALARLPKRRLQGRRLQSQVGRHEGHRLNASRHGSC